MSREGTSSTNLAAMRAAADARQSRLIGHHDLGGHGDAIRVGPNVSLLERRRLPQAQHHGLSRRPEGRPT